MKRLRASLLATVAVPLATAGSAFRVGSGAERSAASRYRRHHRRADRRAGRRDPSRRADAGVAGAPFNFTQDVTPSNNTRIDAKEIARTGSPSAADTLQRARAQRRHPGTIRQFAVARRRLSRLRLLADPGHAAGPRRLSERRAHQRGLRRHDELGHDPDLRHRLDGHDLQQSGVRPQRARRRRQHQDEGRLHLSGRQVRDLGRLLRAHPGRGAITASRSAISPSTARSKACRTAASASSAPPPSAASTAISAIAPKAMKFT